MAYDNDLDFGRRLGDYLRALRQRADVSQRELAARAGVPQKTLARLESDGAGGDPRLSTVVRLLAAADAELAVLDRDGGRVRPRHSELPAPRDLAGRYLPAHLDEIYAPQGRDRLWWQPPRGEYTFIRQRGARDRRRRELCEAIDRYLAKRDG